MQLAQQTSVPGVERDTPAQDVLEGVSSLIRAVRCIEHRHLWPDSGLRRADASVLKVLAKDGEQRDRLLRAQVLLDHARGEQRFRLGRKCVAPGRAQVHAIRH